MMPDEIGMYYEPFLGGGSVLLELKPKMAIINDINKELMATFDVMRSKKEYPMLISMLETYQNIKSQDMFYKMREMDRKDNWSGQSRLMVAARFIFLNRTNYMGIFRCNPKGYNNTPVDHHRISDKFDLVNRKELDAAHEYLSNTPIRTECDEDYVAIVSHACENDFVLIDPPYDYYDEKSDYNNIYYGNINFSKADQIRIYEMMLDLTERGVKFMAFNFDTPFIMDLYSNFNIIYPEKKLTLRKEGSNEIIVTNY